MKTLWPPESCVKVLRLRGLSVKNCQVVYYLWVEFRVPKRDGGAPWQARQFPQLEHKQTSARPAWHLWSSTLPLRTRMISRAFLAPSVTLLIMTTKLGATITREQAESGSFTSSL